MASPLASLPRDVPAKPRIDVQNCSQTSYLQDSGLTYLRQRASQRKEPFVLRHHPSVISVLLSGCFHPSKALGNRIWLKDSRQLGRMIITRPSAHKSNLYRRIADQALSQEILDLVQQASHYRQLKKVRRILEVSVKSSSTDE